MIHLICGPIGAGKTTYTQALATKLNAVYFSEDEWLNELFVPDAPEGLLDEPMQVVGAWAGEKYQRCRHQIWRTCQQLLINNVTVILDGASATVEQRDLIRQKAINHNVDFQLHYVNADASIRSDRVLNRNKEKGETYSLEVTPEMFAYTEAFFEPPKGVELEQAKTIQT